MRNILIINFPAEGHVNPTLGMTKGFVEQGDQVHYITTEKYKERIEGLGAKVYTHRDLLREYSVDAHAADGLKDFLKVNLQSSMDILALVETLSETIEFDFVFFDTFGAGELVQEYLGVPGVASSATFLIPDEYLSILPLHPDSDVPLEIDEECERLFNELETRFGVAPKSPLQFMKNRGNLTIVYTSRYFQPVSERFGDRNVFIGPSFPKREEVHSFPLSELEDEQVIYISMGTVLDNVEEFFNTCIEAFADFEGKVVIAAGEKADFSIIRKAPDNFIISPYVPQLDVLRYSDVFITHGGMNSVSEGIHFNVPLIVVPHDKDQPMIAGRLAELEAGYPLSKDTITAENLQAAVHEVLSNNKYKTGIKTIHQSFEESGGVERALDTIDAFIES